MRYTVIDMLAWNPDRSALRMGDLTTDECLKNGSDTLMALAISYRVTCDILFDLIEARNVDSANSQSG